jgi:hypothetical protein
MLPQGMQACSIYALRLCTPGCMGGRRGRGTLAGVLCASPCGRAIEHACMVLAPQAPCALQQRSHTSLEVVRHHNRSASSQHGAAGAQASDAAPAHLPRAGSAAAAAALRLCSMMGARIQVWSSTRQQPARSGVEHTLVNELSVLRRAHTLCLQTVQTLSVLKQLRIMDVSGMFDANSQCFCWRSNGYKFMISFYAFRCCAVGHGFMSSGDVLLVMVLRGYMCWVSGDVVFQVSAGPAHGFASSLQCHWRWCPRLLGHASMQKMPAMEDREGAAGDVDK